MVGRDTSSGHSIRYSRVNRNTMGSGDGNPQCDCPEWFPIYEKILARNKLLVLQTFDNKNNIPKIVEEMGRAC